MVSHNNGVRIVLDNNFTDWNPNKNITIKGKCNMINGWSIPAIAFAVVSQAAAAIWWASDTNTKVERNTNAIEQVVENEKEIAVVQMQQQVIVDDIKEMKSTDKEMRDMINRIYEIMRSWEE